MGCLRPPGQLGGAQATPWEKHVNMAITFAIRYGLSQLANAVTSIPGAPAQATGSEGLDNLYQGQLDDTLLAFVSFLDPRRGRDVGPYGYNEWFETGTGSAFTISSVFTIREGWWKTRPYTSFKFDVGDGSPFVIGEDIRLGSQVSAERRGVLYRDQIMAIKRTGSRDRSNRPVLSFGDDSREEDPVARGMASIATVANFAALLAGSGDLF